MEQRANAEPRPDKFGSFAELHAAHQELMREQVEFSSVGNVAPQRTQAFIERTAATGAVLELDSERKAAQNILDYWCAENLDEKSLDSGAWKATELRPFEARAKPRADDPQLAAEAQKRREDARKRIQLAATGRLWLNSGRIPDYLLKGAELEEAKQFRDADVDIERLVAASELAILEMERRQRRIGRWAGAIAGAIVVAGIAGTAVKLTSEEKAAAQQMEYEKIIQRHRESSARQASEAVAEQQQTIDRQQRTIAELERKLRVSKIAVPARPETSADTEVVSPNVAQTVKKTHFNAGFLVGDNYDTGFIWIGPDSAQGNLVDVGTGATVLPSQVKIGGSYRVSKNLVFREAKPAADYELSKSIGIVPAGATVTAIAVPVPYARPHGTQYWLNIRTPRSDQPIIYFQYAGASAGEARAFSEALQALGYRIPGVERIDLAKGESEIRFFFKEDRNIAEKAAGDATTVLRRLGYKTPPRITFADRVTQQGAKNYRGVLELWLDLPAK